MTNELIILLEAVVSSGVVFSLVNALKKAHPIFDTLAPVVSMVIGVALGLVLVTWIGGLDILQGVLSGMFIAGFTSSSYAQVKKLK